jgi:cellulose synthase/poly-beta-1,6-N-acetylglucosamine synthase-like glycosyltransferase
MKFYSVIIPVFNRPHEIKELLESLTQQTLKNFEVIIIEDGSEKKLKCEAVCSHFKSKLDLKYFYKDNTGQGFSRNAGFERAKGEYLIVFDSDCIIPPDYLQIVDDHLQKFPVDAFGGPDAAMSNFTPIQKAISYSMTSFFTTGGIRGGKVKVGKFRPRSFNMGISKEVFEKTGGYVITRMAEDLEFSIRIERTGFKLGLIPEAKVYHKRRTSLNQFYRQLFFFGRGRINVFRFYKNELKLLHLFPMVFSLAFIFWLLTLFIVPMFPSYFITGALIFSLYSLLIFCDSLIKTKEIKVAFFSIATSFTQLFAYGMGFIKEAFAYLKHPNPSSPSK